MADIVDKTTRSRMMAGIRGTNTKPEIALRKMLHSAGFRYRLHPPNLPGRPDIVLPSRRAAIFVHGCFWHRHGDCHWCSTPGSNTEFWREKFKRNAQRDIEAVATLRSAGWRVAVVWECGLREPWVSGTAAEVVNWLRCGLADYESGLVRPKSS